MGTTIITKTCTKCLTPKDLYSFNKDLLLVTFLKAYYDTEEKMLTNLDKMYKTDKNIETQGIWFKISDEIGFLVKRFGGFNSPDVKAAMAKHYRPYAKQIESGTLSHDKEREVLTKAFVDAVVMDWKGVEIDGAKQPFSKELAVKFFLGLPDLLEAITQHATDANNYREDLGN